MHPSMIHFAILLLLFSPLFILVGGVLTPLRGRAYLAIVFMLFLLGTASVLVAMDKSRETVQPGCVPTVQKTSLTARGASADL
jgi:positive regulator of sigma E activity